MKTKDFEEIVNAAFNLGFQAGLWPSKKYDKKEQKKAKRKLLKLQQRHLTSQCNGLEKPTYCAGCGYTHPIGSKCPDGRDSR